jgi:hypothetical protein
MQNAENELQTSGEKLSKQWKSYCRFCQHLGAAFQPILQKMQKKPKM